ncbi:GNAT family N-acetyltransferase [Aurantiacibacter sp. MUD61]|uniref:GNAT family N-acetyltransferase n=1 Tax=Aurantiacibacter sp. MUD61 TaxID=3009083 RepID=UPI0022F0AA72|nr:GNAT family N-acetyltransferase [Aurantiacibacter sp. MUD61]
MFMRTQRLFLRPVFLEDWRGIYRGIADESIVRNLARAPWPYTEDDARQFCALAVKDARKRFVITLPDEPGAPIIGMIGFEQLDSVGEEVGYWIGRDWQGRGYATEALHGVVEIADAIGIDTIEARHFFDNPASGRVLRKAGFADTGEIAATRSLGRGDEKVLSRRYVKNLRVPVAASERPAAA